MEEQSSDGFSSLMQLTHSFFWLLIPSSATALQAPKQVGISITFNATDHTPSQTSLTNAILITAVQPSSFAVHPHVPLPVLLLGCTDIWPALGPLLAYSTSPPLTGLVLPSKLIFDPNSRAGSLEGIWLADLKTASVKSNDFSLCINFEKWREGYPPAARGSFI